MSDEFDFGSDYDDFFSDESTEDVGSDQPQSDQEQVEGQQDPNSTMSQEQVDQMVRLKYNHEEKEIPLSEAIQLAQKGLNYDKLYEKVQMFENDESRGFLEDLAAQNSMSIPEFIQAFRQEQLQNEIDELVQNNIPPEYAEEMVRNREFRNQLEQERLAQEQQQERDREHFEFFEQFERLHGHPFDPNKHLNEIPQDVFQMSEQGIPLKYAYLQHFVNRLQTENAVLKQNQQNLKRSPVGSTTGFGSSDTDSEDEFLAGFNSI